MTLGRPVTWHERLPGGHRTKGYVVWCERGPHVVPVYVEAIETLAPELAVMQAESSLGQGWKATNIKRLRGRASRPELVKSE